ncbi:MAG: hypothetical protein Q6373_016105, partial [Candidatus Sigynarchaeota archaeon]
MLVSFLSITSVPSSDRVYHDAFSATDPMGSFLLQTPTEIGSFDEFGTANDVHVYKFNGKTYVILAANEAGMIIVNMTDPFNPVKVSQFKTGGIAMAIDTYSTYAFIADYDLGLVVANITDIAHPTLLGTWRDNDGGHGMDLIVSPNVLFFSDMYAGVEVIYLGGPSGSTFPDFSNAYECSNYSESGYPARGLAKAGNRLYVAYGPRGMKIFDIVGANIVLAGSYFDSSIAYNVATANGAPNIVYVSEYRAGFEIINATNASHPVELENCSHGTFNRARDIVVNGALAYVAFDIEGMLIVDISNPPILTKLDSISTTYPCVALCLDGGVPLIYMACSEGGLQTVNIADVDDIFGISTYTSYGHASGLQVTNNQHVFLASNAGGLEIINVADPTNPVLRGYLDTAGQARAVSVSGSRCYVADYTNGLLIVDVSNYS